MQPSSRRSWHCWRRGARRGPWRRTAATSNASARSSAARSRPRPPTSSTGTPPSSGREGLSPATLARKTAAARSFFRHLQLVGARADNPAAEVSLPRRTRKLPRTLSPGEAERLIDAASRHDAPCAPRSRARRAALRRRPAGLGGDGAREGRRRPRRPRRPRHRQGRQGAGRPDRPRGGRGAPPLPLPRPALPRPPAPAGALPQREGRRADPLGRVPDPAPARRDRRARGRARASPPAPALVRHAPARGRRRPAQRAGDARPRRPEHHRALHARHRPAAAGGLLPGAPARARRPRANAPAPPCGAAPARPCRPRRAARGPPRRCRQARRGSGSCRAAASRCAATSPRAGGPRRSGRA